MPDNFDIGWKAAMERAAQLVEDEAAELLSPDEKLKQAELAERIRQLGDN